MKTDKEWGEEVARGFKGLTDQTRNAIAVRAAYVVRLVRQEMDAESAMAIERFIRLTDEAATYRKLWEARKK